MRKQIDERKQNRINELEKIIPAEERNLVLIGVCNEIAYEHTQRMLVRDKEEYRYLTGRNYGVK